MNPTRSAAVERIRDTGRSIDAFVNNAGVVWTLGPMAGLELGDWSRAITIDLVAVVTLTLTLLAERRSRDVNGSSGVAERRDSMIGGNAYVTGKTALASHTLNLAAEPTDAGATVNAYRPSFVEAVMQAGSGASGQQRSARACASDSFTYTPTARSSRPGARPAPRRAPAQSRERAARLSLIRTADRGKHLLLRREKS